jgi:CubicO group peptidase (beta-lactamase class C family)
VICQMLLDGGSHGGVRLLSPATVEMMTTNRLNDYPDLPEPIRRTRPWGLGWSLNNVGQSDTWGDLLSSRVFGHTGSTGTMCWMDPDRRGFALIFTTAIRSRAPWRLVRLSNAISAAFEA